MQTLRHYFPGGNTPEGFFSFYHEILDTNRSHAENRQKLQKTKKTKKPKKLAVIKGGPGTGKSTFLKELGKTLSESGETVTYLHCSSDPDSLDGILLPQHNSAVIDGTSPHMTDAKLPGVYDTVLNFCDFIGNISDKEAALFESEQATASFLEGYCYLKSAKALLELMNRRSESVLREDEIRAFASNLAKRLAGFPASGYAKQVFLTAITGQGFRSFLQENLKDYHVISVEAEAGDATYRLMETVENACRLRNADVIACHCPMNPSRLEHLIFPSANLALVTSNSYHLYSEADEMVSFSDMITHRVSNRESRSLYDEALRLAVQAFQKASGYHNRLEAIYKTVTDYAAIEPLKKKALAFLISS